jgi:ABC-type multidrug transport system ATPase subunit
LSILKKGHNGAGKSTTMKIITGETAPTKGQVKIGGFNITNNQSDAFKMLGYCPQVIFFKRL